MAKELPYFKFFCSEWNDGDITLEDYKTQGLFINICSYYWSNKCNVFDQKLRKKFKGNNKTIDKMIESGLIKCQKDLIKINFLDEQLTERQLKSSKNRDNANSRWKKAQSESDANAQDSQSESDPIKKREEERRKEEIKQSLFISEEWKIGIAKLRQINLIDVEKKLSVFLEELDLKNDLLNRTEPDIKRHFINWLGVNKPIRRRISL